MGTLYIVSTPIGNLKDITLRALEILKLVDIVACEDTRTSGVLLKEHSIKAEQLISLNDNNEQRKLLNLITKLEHGANIALISDAGTPLISDPGYKLVKRAIKQGIKVIPIPGPSALLSALTASGLPPYPFMFVGFLSKKKNKLKDELTRYSEPKITYIAYEANSRIEETLKLMTEIMGEDTQVCIGRELTKLHEEFIRGAIKDIKLTSLKGEITLLWHR
ncbi:16S rRNA (cytidine(1402)-2'-O)-methyltransferase [Candidatus Roizmanbacteria bacterium CG22_combo_CG10-13_8_21_14_all_38_20]|uniref:Ribosomal RNA small subunit methyltransferase I n=1 Tax=Candidatus Roizmanbacteria bacterium CG22_combo_CG10-13_8_21_14_all_38_20 TaxID=1974862 RepID=A0A2H0BUS3_9BACT|nr:16S rRNA (cytidine(1402)-2'-O)-methyltransferase [Candidatus Microgenomates bacterium]PIP61423.1 MAG: 16S rRNA (cytidine(1402)-2'-O)-methyltransferase [Candidatus Roizmanbacteria bacterium CG22_combo_CG10-13_8_21_14_all_38_20]PIQ35647.1 MAG: 16S rRNA (cytidine(1402)-2'-O)-methyltransferase [Candidatus Yonathbacteria bacterium CG17_big_fil_post_rev_8_21_14_2_50_43_9]PJC32339.1 MAG: 16S rRNA (cytidine(1402)-2'-O)-methyltransferase [Candidatus Roizmanbacteria bacterium CG_4_9_14_0_2_um_filter_38